MDMKALCASIAPVAPRTRAVQENTFYYKCRLFSSFTEHKHINAGFYTARGRGATKKRGFTRRRQVNRRKARPDF